MSRSVVCDHSWGYVISWETESRWSVLRVVRRLDQLFSDLVGKRYGRQPSFGATKLSRVWIFCCFYFNANISNIDCSITATVLCVCDQVRLWLYILIRKVRLLKMGPIGCPQTSVNNYNVRCIIFQDGEGLKVRYVFCIGNSLTTSHEKLKVNRSEVKASEL